MSEPCWIVVTPKPMTDAEARWAVWLAFAKFPSAEEIEVCTPPFQIEHVYVIDKEAARGLEDDLIFERRLVREAAS